MVFNTSVLRNRAATPECLRHDRFSSTARTDNSISSRRLESDDTRLISGGFGVSYGAWITWGGSVAEWLACWTQALKGPGSSRRRDAVG